MIDLSLTLKHRINSIDKYYKIPFKKCDLKDHQFKDIPKEEIDYINKMNYLCPEITSEYTELFFLKNK